MRLWWPPNVRVSELAVEVLHGKARWHPATRGWYVPPRYRDEVYEALCEL